MNYSYEAIQYQDESPFAADLTALMQSCIDYVNKLPTKAAKLGAYKYLRDRLRAELPPIVFKHSGLVLESVKVSTDPNADFCIMPIFGNLTTRAILEYRYSGAKFNEYEQVMIEQYTKEHMLSPEWIAKTAQQLDLKTGRFNGNGKFPDSFKAMKATPIRATLFFDPYYAFMAKETYHVDVPAPTARELAAICLHEIGHSIATIEHATQRYLVFDEIHNAIVQEIKSKGLTKAIRDQINSAFTRKKVQDMAGKDNSARLDRTQRFIGLIGDMIDSKKFEAYHITGTIKIVALTLLMMVLVTVFLPIWIMVLLDESLAAVLDNCGAKYRDLSKTTNDMFVIERYADQFVSQHGYGPDQASALIKLHHAMAFVPSKDPSVLQSNKLGYFAIKSIALYAKLMMMHYPQMSLHGTLKERLSSLKHDVLRNLANPNLPPEYAANLVDELTQLETVIAESTRSSTYITALNAIDSFYTFIGNNLTPAAIVALVQNGNLVFEYTRLKNQVQSLIANPLFATAVKLENSIQKS